MSQSMMSHRGNRRRRGMSRAQIAAAAVALGLLTAAGAILAHLRKPAAAPTATQTAASQPAAFVSLVPDFRIRPGRARAPLAYRIVSFHRGRADKNLIKLAAQLGFNGVQFQLEGSNEAGIRDFAERDAKEHLVDYCHQLGMKVTVWVHELSDLPDPWLPEYLGTVSASNERLWSYLDRRYDWILGEALPQIDGLVLTVVETQVRATQTPIMLRVADIINQKCQRYGKSLVVRTFVWHPEELAGVMGAVEKLPPDAVIMSKCVPQDWQMRGQHAKEIGAVGGRPQIIEYDICGEYFLKDHVANCMVELLKAQFEYDVAHGASGICVRVDRDEASVLFQPSEANLWTLGLLASGATDNTEEIWRAWASYRYGAAAADGVTRALKPTQEVVAELLSIGPFSFGDTRRFPPLVNEDAFRQNWQNWRWDRSYLTALRQAEAGDAKFIQQVAAQKAKAMALAQESLAALEDVRPRLTEIDYAILRTKLLTNQAQLAFRAPMALALLRYRALMHTRNAGQRAALRAAIARDLEQIRAVAAEAPPVRELPTVEYLGRNWPLGAPEEVNRERLYYWAYQTEEILRGRGPKPAPPTNR